MAHPSQKLEPRNLILIENVRAHPELWKSDEEKFHSLPRSQKHRLWDEISRRSGFQKTQDAKNKWRTLTFYLRQHMTNVEMKVHRRYIPNTGNPKDKYVQPEDWRYYQYMQFMEHYNKAPTTRQSTIAQHNLPSSTNSPKTTTAAAVITNPPKPLTAATPKLKDSLTTSCPMQMQIGNIIVQIESTTSLSLPPPPVERKVLDSVPAFDQLPVNDQNLLAFFDSMLRSTQRLPKFHQERVKRKFMNAIRKQK